MMPPGSCCCPVNQAIVNDRQCAYAHQQLGLSNIDPRWVGANETLPNGCSTIQDGSGGVAAPGSDFAGPYLHFNTNTFYKKVSGRPGVMPICYNRSLDALGEPIEGRTHQKIASFAPSVHYHVGYFHDKEGMAKAAKEAPAPGVQVAYMNEYDEYAPDDRYFYPEWYPKWLITLDKMDTMQQIKVISAACFLVVFAIISLVLLHCWCQLLRHVIYGAMPARTSSLLDEMPGAECGELPEDGASHQANSQAIAAALTKVLEHEQDGKDELNRA